MDLKSLTLLLFLLALLLQESLQGQHERRLLKTLFVDRDYEKLERPVHNETTPINVTFGMVLQQIIDVDEKNQIIHTNLWLSLMWTDINLAWQPEEYGNITQIRIPPSKIWRPDILMYNSADEAFDATYPTNVILSSDGGCLWVPPGMFKSTCQIDITYFPFDDQKCKLKFGSWTHNGIFMDLHPDTMDGGDMSSFIRNGEWELLAVPVERNVVQYDCCPETYIDLTFTIHIRRRTLYYGFNIIIPCVLISSMSLLLFILPPDAGEKISLGVTVLLSLMVFLLLVAETMPPTSDALPLIGLYFACIMFMCSLSVVFTVIVLNFHHRSPDTHTMPAWVKRFFCGWLACLLRMSRPGSSPGRRVVVQRSKLNDMRLEEKSRSLMANVLDIDDDLHVIHTNGGMQLHVEERGDNHAMTLASSTLRHDIVAILKELRRITARMRKEDEETEVKNDWKFAAMVMDRLCLIICVGFTVASTAAIMGSAPHLVA